MLKITSSLLIISILTLPIASTYAQGDMGIKDTTFESNIDFFAIPEKADELNLVVNYDELSLSYPSRRLSWWMLFYNMLHHGPCPPHCPNKPCPEHCLSDSDAAYNSSTSEYYDDAGNDDGSSGGAYYSNGGHSTTTGSHSTSTGTSANSPNEVSRSLSRNGIFALVVAIMAAILAAVAIYVGKGHTAQSEKTHPLQGSLGRRMTQFSDLVNKNILNKSRPDRVVDIDNDAEIGSYVRA